MLVTEHHERIQIVVLEARELVEHYVAESGSTSMVGNIYLGRVQNVLPGMEAAFVDLGRGRNAVLYAGEVSYDEEVEGGDRRIEQVLKPGQSVVVQVTKDPLRGKGARLTAQISLPGRYLVYVPDGGASGISRRLPDAERDRLKKIVKEIRPSEAGVIVRTAAEGASADELAADLERLKKAWESIKGKSKRGRPPKTLYEEPELLERVIRDVFSPAEFERIVTDSKDIHGRIKDYLETVAPDQLSRLELHDGALPLLEEYHVTEQVTKALERKIWLPSGGYLIIDRVEAMTVIDVNTGKSVGKTNLEETVVGTNLEAAKEIARQLRLRDIGGIIVVDFIDMLLARNRNDVIRTFQEALAHDKTRSQVFDITPLGLLEMTRKKVSAGLLEAFSEPCPQCEGRGFLLTYEA
jgi:ribonuclease E